MRKFIRIALALAFLLPVSLAPVPDSVEAQWVNPLGKIAEGEQVGGGYGAFDLDTGLLIKYVGTSPAGGTVTVETDGNITLKSGVVGASTADATVECPVSGGLGGIIDVSDAACNTFGEVVDVINSSSNWRAVLVDVLRSDSSDDTLLAAAEANASAAAGLALLKDSSVALDISRRLDFDRSNINAYVRRDNSLVKNPYEDSRGVLFLLQATTTYSSGTSFLQIYSVKDTLGTATTGTSASGTTNAAQTATLIYQEAGGATTVQGKIDASEFGIFGRKGEVLFVRVSNSAVLSAGQLFASGIAYKHE